jgi:putative methionine-R-sulfoxide reductase with GAF domain
MPGSPQSDDSVFSGRSGAVPDPTALAERELDAALQLLVERAQYITGATGTALALPQGDEMVCRASAGACAPAVGARLQVRSGLTGESIVRRQLLRCDNAETDPRVNLETCRALGIASIVVLPLLRRNGEVRGLFELFSDHPYAFEERDLVALERMAALTLTALDLAEQRQDSAVSSPARASQTKPAAVISAAPGISPAKEALAVTPGVSPASESTPSGSGSHEETSVFAEPFAGAASSQPHPAAIMPPEPSRPAPIGAGPPIAVPEVETAPISPPILETAPELLPVPEAMRRVRKCASCGFPVSEGRSLCLDCENLERLKIESEKKLREKAAHESHQEGAPKTESETGTRPAEPVPSQILAAPKQDEATPTTANPHHELQAAEPPPTPVPDEIIPAFLANSQLVEESWMARHVNLLAILVMIAAILVAVVVFFR